MIKEKNGADAFLACLENDGCTQVLAHQSFLNLHTINQALWHAEDQVRDRGLDPQSVAALKRRIDHLNLERHGAIAAIDRAVDALFLPTCAPEAPGVVLNSESVGQMLDRLSILALKRAAWRDTPRAAEVERRIAWLGRCLDRVLGALLDGTACPQRFDEAKTYSA